MIRSQGAHSSLVRAAVVCLTAMVAGIAPLAPGPASAASPVAGPTTLPIHFLPPMAPPVDQSLNLPPAGMPPGPERWAQNERVLLKEMGSGNPIRDASVDEFSGDLVDNSGYLARERGVLRREGWGYDPETNLWSPGG